MTFKKITLILTLCIFSAVSSLAQTFDYKAGYLGFFDNREYDNIYAYDQSMFGSRIRAEAGALIDDHTRFAAGIDYLYEFGSKGELITPDIILYFNGSHNKLSYAMGAMPRYGRINMPLALLTDTLNYYRPNMEGIFLEYSNSSFRHNLWVDWTGRRSQITRESFTVGLSGYINKGLFVYRHHLVINHLAHTEPKTEGISLRDNMGYSAVTGVNLSSVTGLDSLTFTVGVIGSTDRIRGEYDFRSGLGVIAEANATNRGFGLHGVLYKGDKQCITSGDKNYTAGFITRADAYYQVTRKSFDSRVQFSYQVLPDATEMAFLFVVRINIDGKFNRSLSN